ncbi:transposase [Burkholderia sp. IT-111MI5]
MILVYRYRVKSPDGLLNKRSRAVNYVWNFCNDTRKHTLERNRKFRCGRAPPGAGIASRQGGEDVTA